MAIWEGEEENLEVEAVETEVAVAVVVAAVVQFVGLNFSVIYVA